MKIHSTERNQPKKIIPARDPKQCKNEMQSNDMHSIRQSHITFHHITTTTTRTICRFGKLCGPKVSLPRTWLFLTCFWPLYVSSMCEHSMCEHPLCEHSYVWALYVSRMCGSTLCVGTLCAHSMCDHSMWALYVWPLKCEHSMCGHSMWALYGSTLYVSSLCVTTLCEHCNVWPL